MGIVVLHLLRDLLKRLEVLIARRQRGGQRRRLLDDHAGIWWLRAVEPRCGEVEDIGDAADERALSTSGE